MMDEGPASASQTLAPLIYSHICLGVGRSTVWFEQSVQTYCIFFPTMCENGRDFLAPVGA